MNSGQVASLASFYLDLGVKTSATIALSTLFVTIVTLNVTEGNVITLYHCGSISLLSVCLEQFNI